MKQNATNTAVLHDAAAGLIGGILGGFLAIVLAYSGVSLGLPAAYMCVTYFLGRGSPGTRALIGLCVGLINFALYSKFPSSYLIAPALCGGALGFQLSTESRTACAFWGAAAFIAGHTLPHALPVDFSVGSPLAAIETPIVFGLAGGFLGLALGILSPAPGTDVEGHLSGRESPRPRVERSRLAVLLVLAVLVCLKYAGYLNLAYGFHLLHMESAAYMAQALSTRNESRVTRELELSALHRKAVSDYQCARRRLDALPEDGTISSEAILSLLDDFVASSWCSPAEKKILTPLKPLMIKKLSSATYFMPVLGEWPERHLVWYKHRLYLHDSLLNDLLQSRQKSPQRSIKDGVASKWPLYYGPTGANPGDREDLPALQMLKLDSGPPELPAQVVEEIMASFNGAEYLAALRARFPDHSAPDGTLAQANDLIFHSPEIGFDVIAHSLGGRYVDPTLTPKLTADLRALGWSSEKLVAAIRAAPEFRAGLRASPTTRQWFVNDILPKTDSDRRVEDFELSKDESENGITYFLKRRSNGAQVRIYRDQLGNSAPGKLCVADVEGRTFAAFHGKTGEVDWTKRSFTTFAEGDRVSDLAGGMPVVVLSSDPDGAHVRAATWDGQRLTQLGCYVVRAAVNDIPFDANWDFVFKKGHFEFRDRVTGELFHPARQPCH